jgi:hypothetical protein
LAVNDIPSYEAVSPSIEASQIIKVAGISEGIEVGDFTALTKGQAHKGRTYETCASGHEEFHYSLADLPFSAYAGKGPRAKGKEQREKGKERLISHLAFDIYQLPLPVS